MTDLDLAMENGKSDSVDGKQVQFRDQVPWLWSATAWPAMAVRLEELLMA